jgi:hypothetical protein
MMFVMRREEAELKSYQSTGGEGAKRNGCKNRELVRPLPPIVERHKTQKGKGRGLAREGGGRGN